MTARAALPGLLLTAAFVRPAPAEAVLPDAFSAAITKAGEGLAAGEDRAKVLDGLNQVLDANKGVSSPYLGPVKALAADSAGSAKAASKPASAKDLAADPVKHLRDSTVSLSPLAIPENWGEPLAAARKADPGDPLILLVEKPRAVIGDLIPLLADRTPTRAFRPSWTAGGPGRVPRVCDTALLLIEYHSLCKFHDNASTGLLLHEISDADREAVARRVADWWAENKGKSVSAGIRAQLPHADLYAKFWMARHLIRLGEKGDPADREFGLEILREHVRRGPRSHTASYAAEILAASGDFTGMGDFYDHWTARLGHPQLDPNSKMVSAMIAHGKRREWELLYAAAAQEVRQGWGVGPGVVWAHVVNSDRAGTQPYAIPILGLAVNQPEEVRNRVGSGLKSKSFSYPDRAAEMLQKQTGQDFGYDPAGTAEVRAAAIQRAQAWWDREGKAKYTIDYIAKNLAKPDPPAKKP